MGMKWSKSTAIILLLAALLAGCGKDGGGSTPTVVVIVSPVAVTVVPNASVQFTAQVSGAAVIAIATSNGAVRAGNVVTITTTTPHGFSVGQTVTISGVTDTSFNGTFTIVSVPSTTTFTYAQTAANATSGSGAASSNAVTWAVNDVAGGNSTFGTITSGGVYTAPSTLPPATTVSIVAGTGARRSSNIVTITTSTAHNLNNGQVVVISGVADTSFNGTFTITSVPSTTTFTLTQSGADATSGGGQVSTTSVTIKATSVSNTSASGTARVTIDSGISITLTPSSATMATSEQLQFSANVTAPPGTGTGVNWQVNSVTGGSSTTGTIDTNGLYTAPTAVPSPATVSIVAVSQVDATRTATATVILVVAAAPTLTAVTPSTVPQGALFQDIYLTGTNLISTTIVRANGVVVPSTFISSSLLRARLNSAILDASGTLDIEVQPQGGTPVPAIQITVAPTRPVLVGASPDSVQQGANTLDVLFNGGFYSTGVTTEFNGLVQPSNPISNRQRTVTLGSALLNTAGLFPIAVRNSAATPSIAASNLAIQPTAAPSVAATLGVGTSPSGVAVNTATGIAVVVNRGSNNFHLIDLATNTVSGPFAAGTAPTGVAVDNLRDLAYIANNGSNDVTVVNASTGALVTTITGFGSFKPVAIGVNPISGIGIVTLESSNAAALIDLTTNTIVSVATVSNGAGPQVAIDSRLNWAVLTPAGAGLLTIVDLGRITSVGIGASGAVRSGNVVTVTTSSAHSLNAAQSVFITGMADPSFNGIFTVATVTSSTTFTYSQTAANATSGGGTVNSSLNVATVTFGTSVRGISINTETARAFFADPSNGVLNVMSILDQTITSVVIEGGNFATAVSPLTDIGISVNPVTDEASVIDLRTPARLHRIGVGADPRAVAVDPGANLAVVANEGSNNVTILNLGAIRAPHVTQVNPVTTFTSANNLNITVFGFGFVSGAEVRLDEAPLGTTTFVSSRMLTATVPAALLATARRFALDVENPGGARSNVADFAVYQAVTVGTAPRGVAIDAARNVAVVANNGSGNASVVDLATGTVTATITTGTSPEAVATLPRSGRAVVTNNGSNNVTFIDLAAAPPVSLFNAPTDAGPRGIAINPDTGTAVVACATANSVSYFAADAAATPNVSSFSVQVQPSAVVFDHDHNIAAVTHTANNSVQLLQFGGVSPILLGTVSGIQLPSGAAYDFVTNRFIVLSSLTNNMAIVDPTTTPPQSTALRVGINPTSIAYNVHTGTLVTVNSASRTITVMDFIDRRVRAILPVSTATPRFAVAIHPNSHLAVVSDEANNRVLLIPLPR
jgi:YVTN family beta-propeller protein